ncbi:MAG TPA: peptidoglycan-binding domain-containing protein [Bryobacteraceae bacterium]|nr:peptidoglycan-binding domain-containing protein [Bryobacteraceae bacterium]
MRLPSLAVALSLALTLMGLAATTTSKSKAPAKKAVAPAKKSVTHPATKSAATKSGTATKSAPAKSGTVSTKAASSSKAKASGKTVSRTSRSRRPVTNWRTRQLSPTADRYKEIQQALVDKGYLKSQPSGVWDGDSIDAMTRFQNDQKLPANGKITAASLIGLGLGAKSAGAPEAPALPGAPGKQPAPPAADASAPAQAAGASSAQP